MIVVLHAAAHLAIKQSATDDDDPVFVREFHRKVSAVLSELFRARFIKKSPRTERKRAALAPTQELEASALPASKTNLANLNTAEVTAEPEVNAPTTSTTGTSAPVQPQIALITTDSNAEASEPTEPAASGNISKEQRKAAVRAKLQQKRAEKLSVQKAVDEVAE